MLPRTALCRMGFFLKAEAIDLNKEMYKFNVDFLLLLISNSPSEINYLHNALKTIVARKYYITSKKLNNISGDISVLNLPDFKPTKENLVTVVRLIFLYNEPVFEKLIIFFKNDIVKQETIDEILSQINESAYIFNDEYLAITRQYVAFNGFDISENKQEINPMVMVENINKALQGEAVDNEFFLLALSEILPQMPIQFDIEEKNIINFFNKRESTQKGSILFTQKYNKNNDTLSVLFTKDTINIDSLYIIKRSDGLLAYVYK